MNGFLIAYNYVCCFCQNMINTKYYDYYLLIHLSPSNVQIEGEKGGGGGRISVERER
jgi:hypothetical protein